MGEHKLIHVGYTNGYQIKYAKEEEGSFYPDTENDCWIPLFMYECHLHRAAPNLEQFDYVRQLESALKEICDRFESKQNLHKDDCFAYQVAKKALES